jgi:hypothetical protein
MDLTHRHYGELIKAALAKRPGWVPLGPLDAARRGRQLMTYHRANYLADLERAGLITCTAAKGKETATIRLTDQGKTAIRVMPDDLQAEFFPLPVDIAAAKQRLSKT